MSGLDPHVVVRAASVYLPLVVTIAAVTWRRPERQDWIGVLLASVWNLPMLFITNLVAVARGWWTFDADGGTLLGIPVDLLLSWVWTWGALPVLLTPRAPVAALAVAALTVDLVLMPAAAPVVQLGPHWLAGDAVCVAVAFVPGQLLAAWTRDQSHLAARASLQAVAVAGLLMVLLPAIAISGSGGTWIDPRWRPLWITSLWLQILAVPAAIGLSAVQEFVVRGHGTPVPFDPPRRLVTSGVYAFVRNPMQIAATCVLAILGLALGNWWVGAASVVAHAYAAGLAAWDEADDLAARHGEAWIRYRGAVRTWVPRWRPWCPPDAAPARLYVGGSCEMCQHVGTWFARRGATGIRVLDAESHADALTRLTYESADGDYRATGVAALARALEHVHAGWALASALVRLPGVVHAVQVVVDASGGQARALPARNASAVVGSATGAGGDPASSLPRRQATAVRTVPAATPARPDRRQSRSRAPARR